jgi:hypothetical protein
LIALNLLSFSQLLDGAAMVIAGVNPVDRDLLAGPLLIRLMQVSRDENV